jgi:hypothetical protein
MSPYEDWLPEEERRLTLHDFEDVYGGIWQKLSTYINGLLSPIKNMTLKHIFYKIKRTKFKFSFSFPLPCEFST